MGMELQEIADRFEIAEVLYRYATALDTRAWALLGSVFADDGVYRMGVRGEFTGPDAIAEKLQEVLGKLDATQHLIGNATIVIDGDRARSTSYVRAQHYRTGHETGGNTLDMGGTYVDELVRTNDGWRIKHRVLQITWRDGNGGIRD